MFLKVTWKWYFFQNKAFVTNIMCFDEWNVNKQLTKVLKNQFLCYLQF